MDSLFVVVDDGDGSWLLFWFIGSFDPYNILTSLDISLNSITLDGVFNFLGGIGSGLLFLPWPSLLLYNKA